MDIQSFQWREGGRGEALSVMLVELWRCCRPRAEAQILLCRPKFTVLNFCQPLLKTLCFWGGTLMQVGCCQGSCCAAVWNGLYTCITSAVRRSVCSQSSHSGSVVSTVALQIKKDPGWRHSTGLFYMESMGVSSNCPRTCKWDRLRAPMGDYS